MIYEISINEYTTLCIEIVVHDRKGNVSFVNRVMPHPVSVWINNFWEDSI